MPAIRQHFLHAFLVIIVTPLLILQSSEDSAAAAPPKHPVVPGFDRIYSVADADSVEGGRILLTELNCVSCHKAEAGNRTDHLPQLH